MSMMVQSGRFADAVPADPADLDQLSFLGQFGHSASASSSTWAAVDLGIEYANRYIYVLATARVTGLLTRSITGCSVAGVGLHMVYRQAAATGVHGALFMGRIPTGLTGDIVLTLNGTSAQRGVAVWASNRPMSTSAYVRSTAPATTLLAQTGGRAIATLEHLEAANIDIDDFATLQQVATGIRWTAGEIADAVSDANLASTTATAAGTSALVSGVLAERDPSFCDWDRDIPAATNHDYPNIRLGAAAADRLIVVDIGWRVDTINATLNSVWIDTGSGFVALTRAIRTNGATQQNNQEIYYGTVPSGTTGTIRLTFDTANSSLRSMFAVYRKTGLSSNVPTQTYSTTATSPTHTLSVGNNAFIVQGIRGNTTTLAITSSTFRVQSMQGAGDACTHISSVKDVPVADAVCEVGCNTNAGASLAVAVWE